MKNWLLMTGSLLLLLVILSPLILLGNDTREFEIGDYEKRDTTNIDKYQSFMGPSSACDIYLDDLSDGKLIISFYQDGSSSKINHLILILSDEKNRTIWSFNGHPVDSFGIIIKDYHIVDIENGNFILSAECNNMGELGLNVRYLSRYSSISTPVFCCGIISILPISVILITISILIRKERKK